MWHVSISQQSRKGLHRTNEGDLERRAVRALAGVGGDREWWYWSPGRVGHLRVPLTPDEAEQLPPWAGPIDDAGEAGTERPRTR